MITNSVSRPSKFFGFTLIELLVVVAIIGLLASIITVGFTQARLKSRDTKRISDMKQLKSGLDVYFANANGYPDTSSWGIGNSISCNGEFIFQVPKDPSQTLFQYTYTASGQSLSGCGTTVRGAYQVRFYMENRVQYYLMNEDGRLTEEVSGNVVSFDSLL